VGFRVDLGVIWSNFVAIVLTNAEKWRFFTFKITAVRHLLFLNSNFQLIVVVKVHLSVTLSNFIAVV